MNIGRGHPFYLDGIIDVLNRSGQIRLVRGSEDIEEISTGLARLGWKVVRGMYRLGSSPGFIGKTYNHLRRNADYNTPGIAYLLLGRDLRRKFGTAHAPVIVSHPLAVGVLRGRPELFYQHGELVAPEESLVSGASHVIVPTEEVASRFRSLGYATDQITVSGLCIEPSLVRQAYDSYRLRLARYKEIFPLTGAFFSSGAEPSQHVGKLIAASLAAVSLDQRVIIFAHKGGSLAKAATKAFLARKVPLYRLDASGQIPADLPPALLVEHTNRREETYLTSKLFPWFDYFVAPSHERTNWALGLGLPMFLLDPPIGSYAPLNRELLLQQSVAVAIPSMSHAHSFGAHLQSLHFRGTLADMARAGWGQRSIDGFQHIADTLAEMIPDN